MASTTINIGFCSAKGSFKVPVAAWRAVDAVMIADRKPRWVLPAAI